MAMYQDNAFGRIVVTIPYTVIATSDATSNWWGWHNALGRSVELVEAYVTSDAAYTGAATNYRSLEILQAAVEMASWDGSLGNDLAADTPQALTLNTTQANKVVDDNETVHFTMTEVGTGLGIGPGVVTLVFDSPTA